MKSELPEMKEVLAALVAYCGPFDDPSIGWRGHGSSHPDLFRCEKCGAEGLDSGLIPHKDGCTAAALLEILHRIKEWKETV